MKKRKSCIGCKYHRMAGSMPYLYLCHYMLDTGEPRGCPADHCDKKVITTTRIRRFNRDRKTKPREIMISQQEESR